MLTRRVLIPCVIVILRAVLAYLFQISIQVSLLPLLPLLLCCAADVTGVVGYYSAHGVEL